MQYTAAFTALWLTLLTTGDHVINGGLGLFFCTVYTATLGHHPGSGKAIDTTVVEYVRTLGNTVCPGCGITYDRRAPCTRAMTRHAGSVVDLFARARPTAGSGHRGHGTAAVSLHTRLSDRLDALLYGGALSIRRVHGQGTAGQQHSH
jgi:hypothetical protein